ncbi:MAG: hypothetical protein ACE5HX_04240 [bacterium]
MIIKTIHELNDEELKEYPKLYQQVFGYWDSTHIPGMVIGLYNEKNELVGFLSGYAHTTEDFYIQAAGLLPGIRKKKEWEIIDLVIEYLEKTYDFKRFIAFIYNTNIKTLIVVLKKGWIIFGTRTDGKQLLVEVIKEVKV